MRVWLSVPQVLSCRAPDPILRLFLEVLPSRQRSQIGLIIAAVIDAVRPEEHDVIQLPPCGVVAVFKLIQKLYDSLCGGRLKPRKRRISIFAHFALAVMARSQFSCLCGIQGYGCETVPESVCDERASLYRSEESVDMIYIVIFEDP